MILGYINFLWQNAWAIRNTWLKFTDKPKNPWETGSATEYRLIMVATMWKHTSTLQTENNASSLVLQGKRRMHIDYYNNCPMNQTCPKKVEYKGIGIHTDYCAPACCINWEYMYSSTLCLANATYQTSIMLIK